MNDSKGGESGHAENRWIPNADDPYTIWEIPELQIYEEQVKKQRSIKKTS